MALLALVLAWGVAYPSQMAVSGLATTLAIPVLVLIIALGVVFDVIGVAAAAADAAPLTARASRRQKGAAQALYLVQHADKVSAFCSDVVGDIAGTVAGGAVLGVGLRLFGPAAATGDMVNSALLALAAALTVGGKAGGKTLALERSTEVMMAVGRAVATIEATLRIRVLPVDRSGRPRRRVTRNG